MRITTIGLDLAKNVFQVHGADASGKAVLRKQLRRDQVTSFFARIPACLVGIEACGSAHHWAHKLQSPDQPIPSETDILVRVRMDGSNLHLRLRTDRLLGKPGASIYVRWNEMLDVIAAPDPMVSE